MSRLSNNPLVQPYPSLDFNQLVPTNPWDYIELAGVRSPGVVKVTNCPRKYRWDAKKVAGAQGQTETYQGWEAVKGIKIKISMWTAAQIDYYASTFLPNLLIDANKAAPEPLTAVYPSMALNGINAVSVEDVGELVKESPAGLWSVTITCMEFRPAAKKNLTSTPVTGPKTSDGKDPAKSQTPLDRKKALTDRLAAMAHAALANARRGQPPFPKP